MKLLFFPKGGEGISQGSIFPMMEIPTAGEGEKTSLNDFQWWAPTDKWQEWLKKNPREWKAESKEFTSDEIYDLLIESFGSIEEDGSSVMGFNEFHQILEEEESDSEGAGISKEEAKKKFTKFNFAFNKLTKDNKIILNLDLKSLPKNQKHAFILDLAGEKNEDVPETRNAYCIKVIETPASTKFYLAELSETILTGEVPADEPLGTTFKKVADFAGQAILGGAIVIGIVGLGYKIATSATFALTYLLKKILPPMAKSPVSGAAKNLGILGRTFARAKYYTTSLGGVIPFVKGAVRGLKVGKNLGLAGRLKTAISTGRSFVGTARAASGLARTTNPVGWIITGVMAAQQAYNFLSTNQAPRLGEIEDEGIDAHDSFAPGSIPTGQCITVCWTQEAGQGGFLSALGAALVAQDTRTTMDIVKLGNFNGKSLFYLVDVHSESYEKILKENSMVLLSFDEGAKFERGYLDNDDLELEFIPIKNGSDLAATTYFQGYCPWDEFSQAYESSDDKALEVNENAPDEYSFYFLYGKSNRYINVTGKLIKNLDSAETVKETFLPEEVGEAPQEGKNESYVFDISSEVLSFSEFFDPSSGQFKILEEENSENILAEASQVSFTETQKIAPYSVEKLEYADKALEDQDLPDLLTFIVPSEFLEAEDNQDIEVDSIQEVTVKSPKKGSIIIETTEVPEPVPVEVVGATGAEGPEVEGGVPVEVTKDEVKIKYRDNPEILNDLGIPDVTKIKDKDKEDKIKFLDFITPEEKKELGMGDWDFIKKVKIAKDGSGNPLSIRFKSGGIGKDRKKKKIKSSDENFDTALKVAERILAGFKEAEDKEED